MAGAGARGGPAPFRACASVAVRRTLGVREGAEECARTMIGVAEVSGIEVRPIAPALGAEVRALDVSKPLDDATLALVRQALLDHLVIFFRGQDLTPERHNAFAA